MSEDSSRYALGAIRGFPKRTRDAIEAVAKAELTEGVVHFPGGYHVGVDFGGPRYYCTTTVRVEDGVMHVEAVERWPIPTA